MTEGLPPALLTCIPDLRGPLVATGDYGWQVAMAFWCRPWGATRDGAGPIVLQYEAVPDALVHTAVRLLLAHHTEAWAMPQNGGARCGCCDRLLRRYRTRRRAAHGPEAPA